MTRPHRRGFLVRGRIGGMPFPRWSLAALLSVVLFAALAAGGYRLFYADQHPNAWLWLAISLAILTTVTLGAWRGRPRLRRPCLGYAAYGWAHLVFVLGIYGWPLQSIYDAERMATNARMGMLIGLLTAIAATWVLPESARPGEP
jgi:hypothetical protein